MTSLANKLRRMADWLDAHPGSEDSLMLARVGKHDKPQISLYVGVPLHAAFPGREASVERHGQHRVTILNDDGIRFEAWEMIRDVPAEPATVVLGNCAPV